jgi:CRISPR/Cas system CSM-associated protein Csm2 small subunit
MQGEDMSAEQQAIIDRLNDVIEQMKAVCLKCPERDALKAEVERLREERSLVHCRIAGTEADRDTWKSVALELEKERDIARTQLANSGKEVERLKAEIERLRGLLDESLKVMKANYAPPDFVRDFVDRARAALDGHEAPEPKACPECARLKDEVERLQLEIGPLYGMTEHLDEEIGRLNGLLYGARCVYCGEVVGKEKQNQHLADDVLREHVEVCPKHPVSKLKAEVERLREVLRAVLAYDSFLGGEIIDAEESQVLFNDMISVARRAALDGKEPT